MGNYITALEWAKHDTGAMEFLTMLNQQDEYTINVITEKLLSLPRIRGRKLYNLWVISEHNFDRVLKLCENCPDDVLTDACSRQDSSGKELVNQYFNQ